MARNNRDQVDPEVLRKARRLVEIYDLRPRITGVYIRSKKFKLMTNANNEYMFDLNLYHRLEARATQRNRIVYDIQCYRVEFATFPDLIAMHGMELPREMNNRIKDWHIVGRCFPLGKIMHGYIDCPVQYSDSHQATDCWLHVPTFRGITTKENKKIIIQHMNKINCGKIWNTENPKILPLINWSMTRWKLKNVQDVYVYITYAIIN